MRPHAKKLVCTIGLMVTLSIGIAGCGSSDLLDQETTRYAVNVDPLAIDGEAISYDVDVVRATCIVEEGEDDEPDVTRPGSLFDFNVQVTIESDLTAAEFRVESYQFLLTPVSGTYGGFQGTERILSAGQMPDLTDTPLNPRSSATSSPVVLPGGSTSLTFLIWSPGDKDFYTTYLDTFPVVSNDGYGGPNTVFTYSLRIVLHCRDIEDNTFTISGDTPVIFGNYITDAECEFE